MKATELLDALAKSFRHDGKTNADPDEGAEAVAMADIFSATAKNVRESRVGEVELAVMTLAKLLGVR